MPEHWRGHDVKRNETNISGCRLTCSITLTTLELIVVTCQRSCRLGIASSRVSKLRLGKRFECLLVLHMFFVCVSSASVMIIVMWLIQVQSGPLDNRPVIDCTQYVCSYGSSITPFTKKEVA